MVGVEIRIVNDNHALLRHGVELVANDFRGFAF